MRCPNCGEPLTQGAAFCPECGARIRQKTCLHCGAAMAEDADFCPMCGKPPMEQNTMREPEQGMYQRQDTQPFLVQEPATQKKGNGIKIVLIGAVTAVIVVAIVAATFLKISSQKKEAALEAAQQTAQSVDSAADTQEPDDAEQQSEAENDINATDSSIASSSSSTSSAVSDAHAAQRENYQLQIDGLWAEKKSIDKNASSQTELNQLAYANYQHWDTLLNDIYQSIKAELSSSEFETLKKLEKEWIAQRDAQADLDASDWVGGTGYGAVYNGSLAESTGERCQWLVDNYLN
ncbi:MAG: zinc-ribbon domain-containing protein [Clostridia bacterium]|nr:zinc-ribbon domain-containing protein [Clostridia bacterium]